MCVTDSELCELLSCHFAWCTSVCVCACTRARTRGRFLEGFPELGDRLAILLVV